MANGVRRFPRAGGGEEADPLADLIIELTEAVDRLEKREAEPPPPPPTNGKKPRDILLALIVAVLLAAGGMLVRHEGQLQVIQDSRFRGTDGAELEARLSDRVSGLENQISVLEERVGALQREVARAGGGSR